LDVTSGVTVCVVPATIEIVGSPIAYLHFSRGLKHRTFYIIFDGRTQMCHKDDLCKSSNDKLTIIWFGRKTTWQVKPTDVKIIERSKIYSLPYCPNVTTTYNETTKQILYNTSRVRFKYLIIYKQTSHKSLWSICWSLFLTKVFRFILNVLK